LWQKYPRAGVTCPILIIMLFHEAGIAGLQLDRKRSIEGFLLAARGFNGAFCTPQNNNLKIR
jgi:hypothetical protein